MNVLNINKATKILEKILPKITGESLDQIDPEKRTEYIKFTSMILDENDIHREKLSLELSKF